MAFLSLYRKYRPKKFADLIGQDQIVKTLKNTIKYERISHAYLFAGPRGTGKTSTAKVYARALNCLADEGIEPCGECQNCQRIDEGQSIDLIEIDAASNRGIEAIRELREKVKFYPSEGQYKIYIIDEVHMLTTPAFNALLKTLEEPPERVIFILATTEPHKVIPTILSRCQRFDFSLLTQEEIAGRLAHICNLEEVDYEDEALNLIAYSSNGGMRDAISLLDQAISYSGKEIMLDQVEEMLGRVRVNTLSQFVNYLAEKQTAQALDLVNRLQKDGRTVGRIVADLLDYCRQLMLIANDSPKLAVSGIAESRKSLLQQDCDLFSASEINYIVTKLTDLDDQLRYAERPDILLELMLVKITDPVADESRAGLARRVKELEAKLDRLWQSGREKPALEVENSTEAPTESGEKIEPQAESVQEESSPVETPEAEQSSITKSEKPEQSGKTSSKKQDKPREIPNKTWEQILQHIRNEDIKCHAMVKESLIPVRKGNNLIFSFPEDKKFHYQQAKSQLPLIERIVNKLSSNKFEVVMKMEGESGQENSRQNSSVQADVQNSTGEQKKSDEEFPLLKQAQQVFGGRIIKVSHEIIDNYEGGNFNEHEENDETSSTDAG